jgi:hypothetical protein
MESFLSRYKILPPLTGFIIGILLAEYLEFSRILVVILFLVFSVIYLVKPNLVFLIFIPIGILFSSGPNIQENNISNLTGKVLDLEGFFTDLRKAGRRDQDYSSMLIEFLQNEKKNRQEEKLLLLQRKEYRDSHTAIE